MKRNTQPDLELRAATMTAPPQVVQVVQVVRPEVLQAPPPSHVQRQPATPPLPTTEWARKVSQWPRVSITGHGVVLYGDKVHIAWAADIEARERAAREIAPRIAEEDFKTVQAEATRLEGIAAAAMAAALEVDDADPRARHLREIWADRADSLRSCLDHLECQRERVVDARAYARTEPELTVAAVRQRRNELLEEIGLEEIDLVTPPGWRPTSALLTPIRTVTI